MRLLAALLLLSPGLAAAAEVDYVRQVKPLLAARCYTCHGALKQQGGLRLDTAAAIRQGGESGPAVAAGKSAGSLLIEKITQSDGETRMPPASEGSPLKEQEIAVLKAWIDGGATGPADEQPEPDPRKHWAFRAPQRPAIRLLATQSADSAALYNPIDTFILSEQQKHGLSPQPAADPRLLLRRVYLDLIGLPPTPEELAAFAADPTPDAYEREVDRLLASPQHSERWGRHWMDIWRYSDWWGLGAEVRNSQKHIWHWRDWIVESLDRDIGYDEMLRQMLAADELYPNDLDKLRSTGFLVRHYFRFNRTTWLDETVEHTSKAFLGLTFNCAKCHDHKYDPIAQTDYYQLRAFFEPYQVRTDQVPGETDYERDGIPRVFDSNLDAPTYRFIRGDEKQPVKDQPLAPGLPALLSFEELKIVPVSLPLESHHPGLRSWVLGNQLAAAERQIAAAKEAIAQSQQTVAQVEAAAAVETPAKPVSKLPSLEEAKAALALAEQSLAAAQLQPGVLEARAAADRARASEPGSESSKQLAATAAKSEKQLAAAVATKNLAQAQLDLLRAAAAKKAEVEKLVAAARDALDKATKAVETPGEVYTSLSGALKAPESNVESAESRARPFPTTSTGRRTALAQWLTDHRNPLAARVAVNHLWNRHLGKPLVPNVFEFGRKGIPPVHPELVDWLAVELQERQWSLKHLHRLMVTSGTYRLSSSTAGAAENQSRDGENKYYWRFGGTRMEAQVVRDTLLYLAGELDFARGGPSLNPVKEELSSRRSLYFVHSHNDHHRFLSMFDDAGVQECYRREQSIVPQQALALFNSRQALDAASKLAARLQARPDLAGEEAFIRAAFLAVLATEPSTAELEACQAALSAWTKANPATARTNLIQTLFNHNDFVTVR